MIEINMNTARLKLSIKGHALAEEHAEHSAICTGVSVLFQGLAWSISKMDDAEGALKSMQFRDQPGDSFMLVIPEEWSERWIRERFKIYGDGMEMMAKCHPESVSMIYDGEKILPEKGEE